MKLSTLQALVASVEEGSMRGGARRVGVSQPALTKIIRDLELELGAPLLQRTSRGVVPTAQGKVLYERAVRAQRELRAAVEEIHQMDGRLLGEIHIAAVPVAVMLLIPETLRTYTRAYPQIQIRISEELYVESLQRLRAGEVDVTLGGIPEDLSSGEFHTEPLLKTHMIPVARHGSPWLQARSLQDLQTAPWVYTHPSTDQESGYARLLFQRHGLAAPPVGATVNSTLALLSLLTSADYVGLLPEPIAQHPMAARLIAPIGLKEHGYPLQVGALLRSDSAPTPALRQLLVHLHRAAHHLTSAAATMPGW